MKPDLSTWGPMTVLIVGITLIVAGVGGVICVVNPETLSFKEYTERLAWLAGAAGALGIGRGVLEAKKVEARSDVLRDPPEEIDEAHEEHDLHEGGTT